MPQVVYVLINQAMPDLVKIGRTDGDIEARIKQLDTVGIPLPFECFAAYEVKNAVAAEKALHTAFGDHRVRDRREFFRIGPDKPTSILKVFGIRNVTPGEDVVEDEADKVALNKARSRQSNFNFEMARVPIGAELESVFDEETRCSVVSNRKVRFREQEMSLSKSALIVAHENGFNWLAVQGPSYWKYEDQTLTERRQEMSDDDSDE